MARLKKRTGETFRKLGKFLFAPRYYARNVNEFPQRVKKGLVYIVSEGPEPDTLIFKCPCGCGDTVYLNLLNDTHPYWRFDVNFFGLVSIRPSVRRTVKCKSHFHITNGRVISYNFF
ncbi:MAG: hypothetical protein JSS93_04020 [Bacteroidetes bacterium]|nr:hypothetical protein [Bacteroidota bacterium]